MAGFNASQLSTILGAGVQGYAQGEQWRQQEEDRKRLIEQREDEAFDNDIAEFYEIARKVRLTPDKLIQFDQMLRQKYPKAYKRRNVNVGQIAEQAQQKPAAAGGPSLLSPDAATGNPPPLSLPSKPFQPGVLSTAMGNAPTGTDQPMTLSPQASAQQMLGGYSTAPIAEPNTGADLSQIDPRLALLSGMKTDQQEELERDAARLAATSGSKQDVLENTQYKQALNQLNLFLSDSAVTPKMKAQVVDEFNKRVAVPLGQAPLSNLYANVSGIKATEAASLAQGEARIGETVRHNVAGEALAGTRAEETGRHNVVTEGQGEEKIKQDKYEFGVTKSQKNRALDIDQLNADSRRISAVAGQVRARQAGQKSKLPSVTTLMGLDDREALREQKIQKYLDQGWETLEKVVDPKTKETRNKPIPLTPERRAVLQRLLDQTANHRRVIGSAIDAQSQAMGIGAWTATEEPTTKGTDFKKTIPEWQKWIRFNRKQGYKDAELIKYMTEHRWSEPGARNLVAKTR
jgi:hypothetical protein